jgi:hypothetical protein
MPLLTICYKVLVLRGDLPQNTHSSQMPISLLNENDAASQMKYLKKYNFSSRKISV